MHWMVNISCLIGLMFQFNLIPLILKPKTSLELHFDQFFFLLQIPWNPWSRSCSYNVVQKNQAKKISIFNFSHAWHATNLKLPIYTINSYFFPLQIKNQPRLKVKSRIVKTLHKKVFETEKIQLSPNYVSLLELIVFPAFLLRKRRRIY